MELSIINSLTLDKVAIAKGGSQLVESVRNGEIPALDLVMRFKAIAKIYKDNQETFDRYARDEAEKHGKEFKHLGASCKLSEVGTEYDYTLCNDDVLKTLVIEFEAAKAKLEERKTYLKALPKGGQTIVDETTGEVVKLFPPIKSSKSSVTITF